MKNYFPNNSKEKIQFSGIRLSGVFLVISFLAVLFFTITLFPMMARAERKHELYVKTAIREVNVDQIHETLNPYISYPGDPNAQYFPNSYAAENNPDHEGDPWKLGPYICYVNDTFEIITYDTLTPEQVAGTEQKPGYWAQWLNKPDGAQTDNIVSTERDTTYELQPDGRYRISKVYKATAEGRLAVHYTNDDEIFYVLIQDPQPWFRRFDHADIEMENGGYYTVTRVVKDAKGNKETTIFYYDADVQRVNECNIYDKLGNEISYQYYDKDTNEDLDPPIKRPFGPDDYEPGGHPGESQYELTSKYVHSSPEFRKCDVYTARFDIDLFFFLVRKTVITEMVGEAPVEVTTAISKDDPEYKTMVLEHQTFDMNHQSMIDALNKCPDHTGLDFNISSSYSDYYKKNPATAVLHANKVLEGGTLSDGQFTFVLKDSSSNEIERCTNTGAGVTFTTLEFVSEGVYEYTIEEVPDPNELSVIYDPQIVNVKVTVTRSNDELVSTVTYNNLTTVPTFTNRMAYTLPATGGRVNVLYGIGITLVISAIFGFVIIKKKEQI